MVTPEYFETRKQIRDYVHVLAGELGLRVVERKSGIMHGAYTGRPLGLEGSVDGMLVGGTVGTSWGPTVLVAFEVALTPPLWVDLAVRGRALPLNDADDFLAEFEIDTTDRRFADGLFDAALKRTLLDANRAGFYPTITDSQVALNAMALGSPRELRDAFRAVIRIAKMLRDRRDKSARSKQHARVADAWLISAGHFGAKLDEDTLELGLELAYGRLTLRAAHPGLRSWRTELALELDPPIAGELRVTTYSGHLERWFTPDIKFGEAEFDDRFLVRASSRELAERVLSSEARAQLLGLARFLPELLVTEGGINATRNGLLDSVIDTKAIVSTGLAAADELLRQRDTRSAYR